MKKVFLLNISSVFFNLETQAAKCCHCISLLLKNFLKDVTDFFSSGPNVSAFHSSFKDKEPDIFNPIADSLLIMFQRKNKKLDISLCCNLFRLNFQFLSCHNAALMFWLDFSTKALGPGQENLLWLKYLYWSPRSRVEMLRRPQRNISLFSCEMFHFVLQLGL